jgi:hypothetical protein
VSRQAGYNDDVSGTDVERYWARRNLVSLGLLWVSVGVGSMCASANAAWLLLALPPGLVHLVCEAKLTEAQTGYRWFGFRAPGGGMESFQTRSRLLTRGYRLEWWRRLVSASQWRVSVVIGAMAVALAVGFAGFVVFLTTVDLNHE